VATLVGTPCLGDARIILTTSFSAVIVCMEEIRVCEICGSHGGGLDVDVDYYPP
jgi:hypothetical protein